MSCASTDVTLKDKYVAHLQSMSPDYVYSRPHFNIGEDGTVLYWNLEVTPPTSEQLDAVVVVKACPVECVGCILKRLSALEAKSREFQEFAASFD